MTAPSIPNFDNRVEFGYAFSDKSLRTRLFVVWESMKPSWCPSLIADLILRATQDVQRELNADCNLRDLNIIYNLLTTAIRSNREKSVELLGWGPEGWVKLDSCLAKVCGLESHLCGGLHCVIALARQRKKTDDFVWKMFGAVSERTKDELEPILGNKFMGYASGKDQQQWITML